MEAAPRPSVDELVATLRARVAERRKAGIYPDGLEDQLDAHFRRIAAHRTPGRDLERFRAAVETLDPRAAFNPGRIVLDSSVPVGSSLHRIVAKLVHRQTQGILEQVQEFADGVRHALRELLTLLEEPQAHVHADLVGQVDALWDRLSASDRGQGDSTDAGLLRGRVEALEALERRRQFNPFYSSDRFEAAFRGSEEEILQRYSDLARRFDGHSPVIDIGCGRGELLTLLQSAGVEARGVETDPVLVADCVERGLSVELADGLEFLRRQPDGSLGGIALIQVVEHLSAQDVTSLMLLAWEKLRPSGVLLMETVNPQSLYVYAHAFYLDPTHDRPVHPAYLSFLATEAGFSEVSIEWRSPPSENESLIGVPHPSPTESSGGDDSTADLASVLRTNFERLNTLLFAPQDYALLAVR